MGVVLAIVENDENDVERDRKTCVSLDKKVQGANRELAQWIADHKNYSGKTIAGWLDCGATRVLDLRKWALNGFIEKPFRSGAERARVQEPLTSNENFEDDTFQPDENVEEPSKVLANVLDSIKQSRAVAEAYRKILKASPFDHEAKKEISDAIELLIRKWRSVQSTLAAKGKADGEQSN